MGTCLAMGCGPSTVRVYVTSYNNATRPTSRAPASKPLDRQVCLGQKGKSKILRHTHVIREGRKEVCHARDSQNWLVRGKVQLS